MSTGEKPLNPAVTWRFHNAAAASPHTRPAPGPLRLVQEIAERDAEYYSPEPDVGSLALFIRTQKSFS